MAQVSFLECHIYSHIFPTEFDGLQPGMCYDVTYCLTSVGQPIGLSVILGRSCLDRAIRTLGGGTQLTQSARNLKLFGVP